MHVITSITLTAEFGEDPVTDFDDLNTDVIVQIDHEARYVATFFSCRNLEAMLAELKHSPDYTSGYYYKLLNMVLVKDLNKQNLHSVIERMVAEGDFQLVFRRI